MTPKKLLLDQSDNVPTENDDDSAELDINDLIDSLDEHYNRMKKDRLTVTALKSNSEAIECRRTGNEKFKKARDFEAIEWYTKSVASAVNESEELALAYANRSAVLYRIRQYAACLHDINRALAGKYPEKLRNKLLDRKAQCLNEIVRASEPDKTLERAEADATDPLVVRNPDEDAEWRKLCKFGNPLIANASSKIKIECDEKWGRHVIATEDIEPGEILSWQKFAVLTVRQDKRFWYCSYCLSVSYALIPCQSCVTQLYCSKRCRDLAHNSYHRLECKVLSFRTVPPTSETDFLQLTAIRMLLIGTEQGAQLQNLMKKLTVRDIFLENSVDLANKSWTSNYLSSLRLNRTFDPKQLKNNVAFVMKVIIVLQKVEFFEQDLEYEEIGRDFLKMKELFAAMLLLNHVASVFGCKFAVMGIASPDISNMRRNNTLIMGSGFCALHNLLNHSCDPNVRFFTRNRKHVLVSVRPINKGEQIFYAYFGSFAGNPIAQRIKDSASLGFTCDCRACVNNWPMEHILMSHDVELLSKNKQTAVTALSDLMWPITDDDILKLSGLQVFEILCKVCKWLHANIKAPSVTMLHCENRLLDFLMLLYDDFSREYLNVESKRSITLTLAAIKSQILKVAEVEYFRVDISKYNYNYQVFRSFHL